MKIFPFLVILLFVSATGSRAQLTAAPSHLKLSGTRSWIKTEWTDNAKDNMGYNIYWSGIDEKPAAPSMVLPAAAVSLDDITIRKQHKDISQ